VHCNFVLLVVVVVVVVVVGAVAVGDIFFILPRLFSANKAENELAQAAAKEGESD